MNQMKNDAKQVAFFDIDGTLLSFETRRIPDSTKTALRLLKERGIKLFISSGRPLYQVPVQIREGFEGFPGFDGYICSSGQMCLDDRGVFRLQFLDKDDLAAINKVTEELGFQAIYLMGDSAVTHSVTGEILKKHEDMGIELTIDPDFDPASAPITQVSVFLSKENEHCITDVTSHVKLVRWAREFADVIPAEGGKDYGVRAVLEHFGLAAQDAYAFGDGGNDITMLEAVGTGVAMGNALDELKCTAQLVTTSVDDDGIYQACVQLGLIDDVLHIARGVSAVTSLYRI